MAAGGRIETESPNSRQHWNRRYVEGAPEDPATFLTEREHLLPPEGRALDVAGGGGRHALWLASRGLDVTLVDIADEACALASGRAEAARLPVDVVRLDLAREPLPEGPWDVVLLHRFFDRDLWRSLPDALGPGGLLLVCQATVTNLERNERPTRRWLLDDGELGILADAALGGDPGLQIVELEEGWFDSGHEARLVLRRAPERSS